MHVEESTQITHPFAEAESKTLLLFVNKKVWFIFKVNKNNRVFCFQHSVFPVKINLCCHVYECKCSICTGNFSNGFIIIKWNFMEFFDQIRKFSSFILIFNNCVWYFSHYLYQKYCNFCESLDHPSIFYYLSNNCDCT
jgi:hypothetical protein